MEGPPDGTGQVANRDDLRRTWFERSVLSQLDHKNLNEDRPEFQRRCSDDGESGDAGSRLLNRIGSLGSEAQEPSASQKPIGIRLRWIFPNCSTDEAI